MNRSHQTLALAVGAAKDHAKAILAQLEREGHAQTARSSTLYLALVMIHQQLRGAEQSRTPVTRYIPDLEQLARRCEGKLAPVKPLIEAAIQLAREAGGRDRAPAS